MLHAARRRLQGVANIDLRRGELEALPIDDGRLDAATVMLVLHHIPEPAKALAEVSRVLKPGGRVGITDVVAEDHLAPAQRAERGSYVGCVAGALSMSEYRAGLAEAGLTDVVVEPTHQVADGMHSAIVRATKPAAG
jgi:ubiquinone/menaquinone biosynthesis C-methylase UbiE